MGIGSFVAAELGKGRRTWAKVGELVVIPSARSHEVTVRRTGQKSIPIVTGVNLQRVPWIT